jgi:4-hydroxybenzoate polyprenyltransferase
MLLLMMYLFRLCFVAASPYNLYYFEPNLTNIQFLLLVITTIFTAASGYIINDIFDVEIDNINHSQKKIVGQYISEENAYNFYKITCIVGIVSTLALAFLTQNFRLSLIPILIMVILNFYAHTFKKQLIVGNFMIAICAAFVILLIALYESGHKTVESANTNYIRSGIMIAAFIYSLFAFLTTFLRELIKDIEDKEGDEQYDCKTIPIVFGIRNSKIISIVIVLILMSIILSFMLFFPILNMKIASIGIAIVLFFPLVLILFLIMKANTKSHFHYISILLKIIMLIGVLTMLYFSSGNGPYVFVQYLNYITKLF